MLGRFLSACRKSGRGLASSLAVAVVLAGAAAGIASPAGAQNRSRTPAPAAAPAYSPAFAQAYQPIQAAVNGTGDLNAAKGQVPALVAAVQSADERHAAGQVVLNLGVKLNDRTLQRQGLELMVASGQVAAAQLGQYQYFIGNLAFEANDFQASRTALEAARTAGYQDESLPGLLAESYFKSNQAAQGLEYLKGVIAQRRTAGTAVPENWVKRGLQVAYENKLVQQANEWSALLISTNPSPGNWTAALQVVNALNAFDPQVQLDLYRLMATTNALTERNDFVHYIEAADPRVMSNEVAKVLQAGVTAGVLTTGDNYYQEVKRVVDERSAVDRRDAPKLMTEARAAANGNAALTAGDVLYSLGQYADAEQMYQLALSKGGGDKDRVLTRLGIAQAQQGKNADAKTTFAQVSGVRAPVARMWEAYVSSKA